MRMGYRRTRAWFGFLERRRLARLNTYLSEHGAARAREALRHAPHG